jgi:drug/metabolite transporter (DMT)-like permease
MARMAIGQPTPTTQAALPLNSAQAGHLAMLAFSAIVAGSFSMGAIAAPHIDPLALNAPRMVLAVAVIAAIARSRGLLQASYFTASWRFLLMGGLMAAYFGTMFWALQRTSGVSTSAVFTLTPILTSIIGWLLLRQRASPAMMVAMAIAAIGALWVIFRADWAAFRAFDIGIGEQVFFAGCACHALYAVLVKKLNRGEPLLPYTLGVLMGCALVLMVLGAPAIVSTDWAALPAIVWITMVYTAVFASALTFFLVQFAAMRITAGQVMAYTYLTPGFVLMWNLALGQGAAAAVVWLGALIAGCAMVALFWAGQASARAQTTEKQRL